MCHNELMTLHISLWRWYRDSTQTQTSPHPKSECMWLILAFLHTYSFAASTCHTIISAFVSTFTAFLNACFMRNWANVITFRTGSVKFCGFFTENYHIDSKKRKWPSLKELFIINSKPSLINRFFIRNTWTYLTLLFCEK